jgi:hypothetical protein
MKYLKALSIVLLMVVVSISCSLAFGKPGPLTFEPDSLPGSKVSVPYETEIQISDNDTPVAAFSIPNGALPAGLELVEIPGEDAAKISGTPEEEGIFTFTLRVWCYATNSKRSQTGEKEYGIVVEK